MLPCLLEMRKVVSYWHTVPGEITCCLAFIVAAASYSQGAKKERVVVDWAGCSGAEIVTWQLTVTRVVQRERAASYHVTPNVMHKQKRVLFFSCCGIKKEGNICRVRWPIPLFWYWASGGRVWSCICLCVEFFGRWTAYAWPLTVSGGFINGSRYISTQEFSANKSRALLCVHAGM